MSTIADSKGHMIKRICDFCKDDAKPILEVGPGHSLLFRLPEPFNERMIGRMWDVCDDCTSQVLAAIGQLLGPGREYQLPLRAHSIQPTGRGPTPAKPPSSRSTSARIDAGLPRPTPSNYGNRSASDSRAPIKPPLNPKGDS